MELHQSKFIINLNFNEEKASYFCRLCFESLIDFFRPFARLWWDETVPTVVTRAEPHNQVCYHLFAI